MENERLSVSLCIWIVFFWIKNTAKYRKDIKQYTKEQMQKKDEEA